MTDMPPPAGPAAAPASGSAAVPACSPLVQPLGRPPSGPPAGGAKPRRRVGVLTVLAIVLLALSLVGNVALVVAIILMTEFVDFGRTEDAYTEHVLEKGPSSKKVAVIRVEGLIDEYLAQSLRVQMQRAARDDSVKAVILRIDSPGGGLTASDMIHHDVQTLLAKKPVIAAMDAVAASGGYYVACAADAIVAQRTTITGSIGVIGQFFFLSGLLKDKLGIEIVTLKMGDQKDWPNMFAAGMPPEQRQYMVDALLKPGYDRFIDTVAESRDMKRDQVLKLATGRIYMAAEAQKHGLIDEVGYFDRAVALAKDRAGIQEARVVEYVLPFRLLDLLGAQARGPSLLDLKPEKLAGLASPRVMYLWTGH
ncbi:MAG: signal peptide peptidase SppA [Planctomycetes bacterium]|nr:signal peptide peptidase SppA [Planctomycetota bacterium]